MVSGHSHAQLTQHAHDAICTLITQHNNSKLLYCATGLRGRADNPFGNEVSLCCNCWYVLSQHGPQVYIQLPLPLNWGFWHARHDYCSSRVLLKQHKHSAVITIFAKKACNTACKKTLCTSNHRSEKKQNMSNGNLKSKTWRCCCSMSRSSSLSESCTSCLSPELLRDPALPLLCFPPPWELCAVTPACTTCAGQ